MKTEPSPKHSPKAKPKPRHRPAKPHYVPKKPLVPPESETLPTKPEDDNLALEARLSELVKSYTELENRYEAADDEFKTVVFMKTKLERERNNIDKELKAKAKIYEKLTEDSAANSRAFTNLQSRLSFCESETSRLQAENTKLLQEIIDKDKEIQQRMAGIRKIPEKVEKGVNTIAPIPETKLGTEKIESPPKPTPVNREMDEMFEAYSEQLAGAKEQLKIVDQKLVLAKEEEEALDEQKTEIEQELEELKGVIKAFNKYEERLHLREPKQGKPAARNFATKEMIGRLGDLKKDKKKVELALEESKINAAFYKLATVVSVRLFYGSVFVKMTEGKIL